MAIVFNDCENSCYVIKLFKITRVFYYVVNINHINTVCLKPNLKKKQHESVKEIVTNKSNRFLRIHYLAKHLTCLKCVLAFFWLATPNLCINPAYCFAKTKLTHQSGFL